MIMENDDAGKPLTRRASLMLTAILVLSACLRFYHPQLVSISNDMGQYGLTTMLMAQVNIWPFVDIPGDGVRNSALFLYLIALANFVYWHPLTLPLFVAGLNVLAVYLAFRLTLERFGLSAALIAALLYACSPWAVLFSRDSCPSSCLAVFCLWFIRLSLRWLDDGKPGQLVLAVFAALVIPQLHFSGFCATVWLIVVLVIGRKRISVAPLLSGLALGFVTWTPWIIFHQMDGWSDLRTDVSVLAGRQAYPEKLVQSIDYFQAMLHFSNFKYWFAAPPASLPEYFPSWLRWALSAGAVGLVLAFVSASVLFLSKRKDRSLRLLVLWSVLPVICLLPVNLAARPDYFLVAYPAPLLLVGVLLSRLAKQPEFWPRALLGGAIIVITASNLLFLTGWHQYVNDDRTTGSGRYQQSYRQRRAVALSILRDSNDSSVRLAGPFAGGHASYEYIYHAEWSRRHQARIPVDQSLRYWIDLEPIDPNLSEQVWLNKKRRNFNQVLSRYQKLPPNWRIEKHWQVGQAHVFRIRLESLMPLKM